MPGKASRRSLINHNHLVHVAGITPFLSVANAGDRAWLTSLLETAMRSRTARQVLRQAAAAALRRGQLVPVQVEGLRVYNGTFDYNLEVLQLARSLKQDTTGEAASVLVHELLHFVQRDLDLPSDALETELEAYIVTLQVFRELGLKVRRKSFSYGFEQALLRGGVLGAILWLQFNKYDRDIGILNGGTIEWYIQELERRRKQTLLNMAQIKKLLAKRRAVLFDLRGSGVSPEVVVNYKIDQIAPLYRRLRKQSNILLWQDKDLAILKDPIGATRYRAFAERVRKRMKRFHRTIAS